MSIGIPVDSVRDLNVVLDSLLTSLLTYLKPERHRTIGGAVEKAFARQCSPVCFTSAAPCTLARFETQPSRELMRKT